MISRVSLCSLILALTIAATAHDSTSVQLELLKSYGYSHYLSSPDKVIASTLEALPAALKSKDNYFEGYCHLLLSKAYWVKANYRLSTEYGFKALKFFRNTSHHEELATCLASLARTLAELGNYQRATSLVKEAIDLGEKLSDEDIIANAYREYSFILVEQDQLDSALSYSNKGLALFKKKSDSINISILYGRNSRIYFQQKRYAKSLEYANCSLMIDSLKNNRRALAISYYQLAQNNQILGNVAEAIAQAKQSIRINSEIGNLAWQIRAHELLAHLYLEKGLDAEAARQLMSVNTYKDELYNSEKNGQIQEMQSLYELEAKERTIQMLEQERALQEQRAKNQQLFLAFLLVAVISLVLLIFVLTRLRKIQIKTNKKLASQNYEIEQQKIAIQVQAENLREIDHIKTKLFSVVSHDLRGPISNLQSLLDLFTKKLMTAEEFLSLSGKLKDNLDFTQRTLENLLNWSLSQMGGIRTNRKKVDIIESIKEACQLLEEVAFRKNISFVKNWENSIEVWADADQLQVILRNIIHNAIKFSSINDRIEISASEVNDCCRVTIKDLGTGMTEDEIETLVGAKDYFSKSGTDQEKGTGLGLMLCKEFISRNGGEMKIKSSPGSGTEVSFTLLLADAELVAG